MEKIIPISAEQAFLNFEDGVLCSQQCALHAARIAGADEQLVADAMLGFARGLGDRSRTCGCLTGAIAGLGLLLKDAPEETRMNQLRYHQAQIEEEFAKEFGGITCASIYTGRPHCCEIIEWTTKRLSQVAGQ